MTREYLWCGEEASDGLTIGSGPIPDRTIRKIDQRTRSSACAHCGESTCPTEATPTPSICGDCCDCLAGTCPRCGAFEEVG